jgi:ubiquinol-cytochrome c reductase cytochrome b subunit
VIRRTVRWLDNNLGGTSVIRRELRHIFPDHWSFFIGEVAMYCFVILVVTGVFLAFFFRASGAEIVYQGSYEALRGVEMTDAYASTLDLSFDVRAGLIMRQIHHWAALVFAAAVVLHLFRMFFTGAYRRPRAFNWLIGFLLLLLVLLNGVLGYSLPDDLLSGTGLRIAFAITESIPLIGPQLAMLLFGGEFPTAGLIARIYPVHIFLVPALIAVLLGLHVGALWLQRHSQFPGPGRDERTVVGTPLVPAYALRTTGFFLLIFAVLAAMGAFLQINPVWIYGPYEPADATTMAQPDWYTTWLEGGLRMFPGWDLQIGGFLLPAIFWPAVVLPGLLFGFFFIWPWFDRFVIRDKAYHNLLDRPSARPGRMALGAGLLTALFLLLLAGGNDVFAVVLGANQQTILRILQGQSIALPFVVALIAYALTARAAPPPSLSDDRERGGVRTARTAPEARG